MKYLLVIISLLFITNANAQSDDRYFDSRKNYSTARALSYAHKRVKVRHYAQRQHRNRVSVPRYAGETYASDPVQWVARRVARGVGEVIGGRPQGCPHRFCGCALAIKIFGTAKRDLWLAANWLRFPRAEAAPGMVAARRGHVFQLVSHTSGNIWKSWDANSGGGRIRIHNRSIAGFTIVNPGSRMAMLY
jgi:hypothetical protein